LGGKSIQLAIAGRVKSHLVQDRAIVIESEPNGKGPLEDGSLLVVRVNSNEENSKPQLLLLGKVFEVFGPIHRPIYTIRLPQKPSLPKKKSEKKSCKGPSGKVPVSKSANDDNEISISDEDSSDNAVVQPSTDDKIPSIDEKIIPAKDDCSEPPPPPPPDDWSENGKYTLLLKKERNVFYIQEEAKMLDTFHIMRTSGKGCDASNLYDEEVLNANDLYFSDDEEERLHKSKGKRKNNIGKTNNVVSRNNTENQYQQRQPNIPGFHNVASVQQSSSYPQQPMYNNTAGYPQQQYMQNNQNRVFPMQYSNPYHPYGNASPSGQNLTAPMGNQQLPAGYPQYNQQQYYPNAADTNNEESDTVYFD